MSAEEKIRILHEMLADVTARRQHAEQFYAVRLDALERLARERGDGSITTKEVWNIIANGKPSVNDPPSMAAMVNTAEYRAARAEAAARELANACAAILNAADRSPNVRRVRSLCRGINDGTAFFRTRPAPEEARNA